MLQSSGKEARIGTQSGKRVSTKAFVLEQPGAKAQLGKPQITTAAKSTHTYTRRSQEATLIGLAPPPIEYAPVAIHVQPPTRREPVAVPVARDDRKLAAILVLGTLIAMFAIAFSAVPDSAPRKEPESKAPVSNQVQAPQAETLPAVTVAPAVKAAPIVTAAPAAPEVLPAPLAPEESTVRVDTPVRPANSKASRSAARSKLSSKAELRRRARQNRD